MNWQPPSGQSGGPAFTFNLFNQTGPGACCAPVTIKDAAGNVIAIVESGGEWTENSQQTFIRTITLKAGSYGKVSFETIASGQIYVTSSTNLASAIYENVTQGTTPTPPYHVNRKDVVVITVTPTNAALDTTLTLLGIFDSVSVAVTDPNLGNNGRKKYVLGQVAAPNILTVTDTGTAPMSFIATVTLTAGVTYGWIAYRGLDNSIYAFGRTTADNMVVTVVDCTTDTITSNTNVNVVNYGITFPVACYNYIHDVFYTTGGGAAGTPIVKYDPVTKTASAVNFQGLTIGLSAYYMGYADLMENAFAIMGLSPGLVYRESTVAGKYEMLMALARTGNTGIVFNRINRKLYITDFNGGAYEWTPGLIPEGTRFNLGGISQSTLCHDFINNQIFGAHTSTVQCGWFNPAGVGAIIATPAVGAETGYKSVEYGEYSRKIFALTRGGGSVRVIDPLTHALDATTPTISVGAQNTASGATGFGNIAFNRVKLF